MNRLHTASTTSLITKVHKNAEEGKNKEYREEKEKKNLMAKKSWDARKNEENLVAVNSQKVQFLSRVGQQRRKRPFNEIDTSTFMKNFKMLQFRIYPDFDRSALVDCNASRNPAFNSSPQTLLEDSPCIVDTTSGNSSESSSQDINDDPGHKKIRRIPDEEKDEKYREKRRRNNLAAKKSRDARKEKEDKVAECSKILLERVTNLEEKRNYMNEITNERQLKLDSIKDSLYRFREKCEEDVKQEFEEIFREFLS
ncbi:unnamed protein product [Larinioides sclopetarius]|uniref:BZIP domain-containing protein n=1 Tax=Larinioides sclopetarius TaxID=280406 RepID=A0AAV2BGC9_9ARAC